MSQNRRKIPFSAKQKKLQLQQKRERKRENEKGANCRSQNIKGDRETEDLSGTGHHSNVQKINVPPINFSSKDDPNRYNLHFFQDNTDKKTSKKLAYEAITRIPSDELEVEIEEIFPHGSGLDLPKRPLWSYSMSKEELEIQEHKYFQEYISNIQKSQDIKNINFFEINLETWRQLWRVLEMSDVLLIIVDIRFAVLLFPPYLYSYIKNELKKPVILILNKADLISASLVLAWKHYFLSLFPELKIIFFTSQQKPSLKRTLASKRNLWRTCTKHLISACQEIVKDAVDLSSWTEKNEGGDMDTVLDREFVNTTDLEECIDDPYREHEAYKNGILTLGCIGCPNVGKSSFINALNGKKVVSVSRTPGHTKHFQTIYVTSNVRLCDCPGLVFPSYTPKTLQILSGSYPVSQVRDPYAVVRYLAERIPLLDILHLSVNENGSDSDCDLYSAMDISEAWAKKRGYRTAKAARYDAYRAANEIIRLALNGSFCFYLRPPSYNANQEKFKEHSELNEIKVIQGETSTTLEAVSDSFGDSEGSIEDSSSDEEHVHKMDNKFAVLNFE